MDIANKLKIFIEEELLENKTTVTPEAALFSSRILDSLALLDLLAFLEDEFSVKIKASEVQMENLDTIKSIETLINAKTRGRV
jgi:acyl carrier protein